MKEQKSKRKIIYFIIIILIIILILVFAILSGQKESTEGISITDITVENIQGQAENVSKPTYDDLKATFNVDLKDSSDSILYTIKVKNTGDDVKLDNIEIDISNNSNITVETGGIESGDTVKKNQTAEIPVTVGYLSDVLDIESGEATITLNLIYK